MNSSTASYYHRAEALVSAIDAYTDARLALERTSREAGDLYPQKTWMEDDLTKKRNELVRLLVELQQ